MASSGLPEGLQAALGSAYTIEREVGRGGMATVFLARDRKHNRAVAVKVLHPELASSLGPDRFRREIAFAAQLQHPHILTVLDSGETPDGRLWFTMPYVEGENLRGRLTRERQMSVDDALRIVHEIAQALDYAHRHGVIHRDIKPENILLTSDGQALVADFGIARALNPHTGEHTLTTTGMAVGTAGYMSPEQATGERALDARSDVYSLGAVLYEMLAGDPPFTGATAQAVIARMMSGEPPSVRRARPAVPGSVDAAIQRALAPVPADRFATAGDFARALDTAQHTAATPATTDPTPRVAPRGRRMPFGLALLGLGFLIGTGVLFAWRHRSGSNAPGGAVRLAVLPFENVGDTADAYFADGLTDAVRGKLTTIPGLAVIAAASSSQYKRTAKTPQQIAQELGGVRYLLVGKVRWAKNQGAQSRVQVSPSLIDVSTGTDAWDQPFDAPLTDVFQVQGDIAGRVVQALGVALTANTRQTLEERPTDNLAAYDAYLKGEDAAHGLSTVDPAAVTRASAYYARAVAIDSTFAPAWARLARAEARLYFTTAATPQHAEGARLASERAHALAPGRPDTYVAQADYYGSVLQDNARALDEYSAGLKIAPSNVALITGAALSEQSLGRWDASLAHLRQSQILDPRDVVTARRLANTLLWLHRLPESAAAADRALALAPDNLDAIEAKAMVPLARGDLPAAQSVIHSAPATVDQMTLVTFFGNYWDLYWALDDAQQRLLLTATPEPFGGDRGSWAITIAETYLFRGDTARARYYADSARLVTEPRLATTRDGQTLAFAGISYAILGRKADAIRNAQRAVDIQGIAQDGFSGPYNQHLLARVYTMTGESDKAIDALESLLKAPYFVTPAWLRIDPSFAPLRSHPRFQRLVAG